MSLRFFLRYFDNNTMVALWDGSDEIGFFESIDDIPLDILNKYNVLDTWIYTTIFQTDQNDDYFDCVLGIDVF